MRDILLMEFGVLGLLAVDLWWLWQALYARSLTRPRKARIIAIDTGRRVYRY